MRVQRFLRGAAAFFTRRPRADDVELDRHEIGKQPGGGWRWGLPGDLGRNRDAEFKRKRTRRRIARASRQYNRRRARGKRARR